MRLGKCRLVLLLFVETKINKMEGVELFITSAKTFSFRPSHLFETFRHFAIPCERPSGQDYPSGQKCTLQIPIARYSEFTQALLRITAKFTPIPNAVLAALEHAQQVVLPSRETLLGWVPEKLLDSLYDYQKEGVAFAVARGGKCMIADEMGVGKSRQGKGGGHPP